VLSVSIEHDGTSTCLCVHGWSVKINDPYVCIYIYSTNRRYGKSQLLVCIFDVDFDVERYEEGVIYLHDNGYYSRLAGIFWPLKHCTCYFRTHAPSLSHNPTLTAPKYPSERKLIIYIS
jgi:hypothetical protein